MGGALAFKSASTSLRLIHFRFPGHEHVTITDGVPEGWEKKKLTEIAEFRLGKMLDQKKTRGDLMPYLANLNVR